MKILVFIKKTVIKLLVLTVPALLVTIFLLEIIARIFLPVSDVPDVIFDKELGNHYLPDQEGIYIRGMDSEIKAAYRINSTGWNSPYDYGEKSSDDIFRIAVIGDSCVEAFQVDCDKSYPYLLERRLNNETRDRRVEVYTFGHSGANLVQYLAVLRLIVPKYNPDLVIINIAHNDFSQCLYGYGRKDNWTLKYDNGSFTEVRPRPVRNLWLKRFLRKSALARYLIVNLRFVKRFGVVKRLLYDDTRKFAANIDLKNLELFSDRRFLNQMLGYIFKEFLKSSSEYGFDLLMVMDTDRQAIYSGKGPRKSKVYLFNKASMKVAGELNIPFIDLTPFFEKKWKEKGEKFDWKSDNHWNNLGHEVVGDAIIQKRF